MFEFVLLGGEVELDIPAKVLPNDPIFRNGHDGFAARDIRIERRANIEVEVQLDWPFFDCLCGDWDSCIGRLVKGSHTLLTVE